MLLTGCLNVHEKSLVGSYKVYEYELNDTVKVLPEVLPTLNVRRDKSFLLKFLNREIEGKWKAHDYGDWTLAEFQYRNINAKGQVGNEQIDIINPWQFECPHLKRMVFKKQTK